MNKSANQNIEHKAYGALVSAFVCACLILISSCSGRKDGEIVQGGSTDTDITSLNMTVPYISV